MIYMKILQLVKNCVNGFYLPDHAVKKINAVVKKK